MKKSASALLIIAAICLSSCHDKKQLGNYVFVDGRKVVHADKDCDMVYRHSSLEVCSIEKYAERCSDKSHCYVACSKCLNGEILESLTNRVKEYHGNKEREEKQRRNEYRFLRSINKDRWGSFEQYEQFVSQKGNEKQLKKELDKEGLKLSDAWTIEPNILCNPDVSIVENDKYRKWLYVKMVEADVDAGTYFKFCQMLENKEDFVWFYDKAVSHGLTDSWSDFIMMLYESDCEGCKETHWDEWMEEYEMYEEMRHDALYDPDIEDERLYDHY